MKLAAALIPAALLTGQVDAKPALVLQVAGPPIPALNSSPPCNTHDSPDAPARAIHLADGTVQLYATDQINQVDTGPDLLHLRAGCSIVYRGAGNDDPASYDDHAWIASPWTTDGWTIFAIVHNEFHGNERKQLCPTGRYMDCWFNALTLAVSADGGKRFQRAQGAALVATLPYRYDQVGIGHHGYFNPTNIVARDGLLYMFAFATHAGAQRDGNCLMRTATIADAASWRAWNGAEFATSFIDPYLQHLDPAEHVCAPVAPSALRWPVTALVRHQPTGLYIAIMQNAARDGGVFYATSPDLLNWSTPALLFSAIGLGVWTCADPAPIAYPSLLDPASADPNFQTVGNSAALFATRFDVADCRAGRRRTLLRWAITIFPNAKSNN